MNTCYLQFIGVYIYWIDLQIKMSNTSTFHQIVQTVEGVSLPKFTCSRGNDGLWTAACTFNDVYYAERDHKLQVAKDKVFGNILNDTKLQPMLSGSMAKRDILQKGYTINIHALIGCDGLVATVKFKSPLGDEEIYKTDCDSIGSLDRFVKSTSAKILSLIDSA
jgi:hypothetical protein